MTNLTFISISDSVTARDTVKKVYTKWGYKQASLKELTEWLSGAASNITLFEKTIVHLNLKDKPTLKKFVGLIDERKKNNMFKDGWFGNGVIISTTEKVGTSKIEKLVQEFGGEIIKETKETKNQLFAEIGLPNHLQQFAADYIGEDLDKISILKTSLANLSVEEKKNLTVEEITVLFPPLPGSVPPWKFTSSLFALNLPETLESMDRYLQAKDSHLLVLVALLKNKVDLLHRYIALKTTSNGKLDEAFVKPLGLNNIFPLRDFARIKGLSLKAATSIVNTVIKLEAELKDKKFVSDDKTAEAHFKVALTKIYHMLRIGSKK